MSSFSDLHKRIVRSEPEIGELFNKDRTVTAMYFSYFAYLKSHQADRTIKRLEPISHRYYSYSGSQAYLLEFDDIVIVTFRGTEVNSFSDWKSILSFYKAKIGDFVAHRGFVNSVDDIKKDIISDLNKIKNKKVLFTGHSMGGAMARLMCIYYRPTHLYTFGEPRSLGRNKDIKEVYKEIDCKRYINGFDFVSRIPIPFPLILNYKHASKKIQIPNGMKWPLRAHLMVNYIKAGLAMDGGL